MQEQTTKSNSDQLKRYNLVIQTDLFDDLQKLADRQGTTVVELIRRAVKLLLLVSKFNTDIEDKQGIYLHRNGHEPTKLLPFW